MWSEDTVGSAADDPVTIEEITTGAIEQKILVYRSRIDGCLNSPAKPNLGCIERRAEDRFETVEAIEQAMHK